MAQIAQNAEQVLRSSGVPANVYIVPGKDSGEPILVISMDLNESGGSLLPSGSRGLEDTIDELLRIGKAEGVDIAGVSAVLHNEEGDPVIAISTSAVEVRAFRDGEITMEEAIEHLGISLIDRGAIIDLITGLR